MKSAYVFCTGCPESRLDSARVQKFLKINGWNLTNNFKEADLIVFRACGLKEDSVQEALQIIRKIKDKKKAESQFIVWGCLPKIDPEALRKEYDGVTFGEKDINTLDTLVNAKKSIEEVAANYVMPVSQPKRPGLSGPLRSLGLRIEKRHSIVQNKSFFSIKVSTGCLGNCSFCAVRKSRGTVRSKSIDRVLSEFRDGLNKGYRYFALFATDLGAYGRDIGVNLNELLFEMAKEKGEYTIGLRNVNPQYLGELLKESAPILSSGKIWFLSSAIESASDRILKLMNRKYTAKDFGYCIRLLNNEFPHIFLRTQIMVGFPTETEEDFQKSLHLLEEIKLDWVEVYKFSPRKGTTAAKMFGQVPEQTKEDRYRRLTLNVMTRRPQNVVKQLVKSYFRL